ncbi:MFS transporter [Faecalibacter rhinopitheci]|uniref:MFS transporter n=1 Tax=Faecalibacter rhinopitheci TaxID=2779678 RepID=A0A8J7KDE1_9FLAO|nr:MFS transporter [Faecalibacter rhinopitheci]MBF0597211.1 MFS transporter [Faecalibacter rhinopitheci]
MNTIEKNNPNLIKAWVSYDWANSVHSLVIASAIFPVYYTAITRGEDGNPIKFLGLLPESAFNFSLAIAFFFVIVLSPVLSSIADLIGNKIKFLRFFCYLGSLSCIGMFFFTSPELTWLGLLMNITGSIGFWGSLVFYNAYLPEIVSEDKMDSVSAKGYMFGYIGSVVLLSICLAMIQFAPTEYTSILTRISFLLTGVWWMGFGQIALSKLPNNSNNSEVPKDIFKSSFKRLSSTFKELNSYKNIRVFLAGFFFYSLAMQTIFLMAAMFGSSEIGMEDSELIMTILLIQIEAILGAWLFSFLSGKIGNKITLLIGIFIWVITCIIGYSIQPNHPDVKLHFYGMAALVGLVMGGLQALSRSTYAKLLPETNDTTTYFSFYDIFEKFALFLGLVIYGLLIEYTGGMKTSALAMGVSFAISFVILLFYKMEKK